VTGLKNAPIFSPIVADFYSGMAVTVPLFASMLEGASAEDVKKIYREKYTTELVKYTENADENGFFAATKLSGTDRMEISVAGNDERILLLARYDNLGKGASGAALECMNISLGLAPTYGLVL
jgi:N-acetyl-gamma-glutamyl-phosphate reductase